MWGEKKIRILKNQHVYTVMWKWRGMEKDKQREKQKSFLSRLSSRKEGLLLYLFLICILQKQRKKKEKSLTPQHRVALPVTGRGGDRRVSRSSSSGFIDLGVESVTGITIRSGRWVVPRPPVTYKWSGAVWGGGAGLGVLDCTVQRWVRRQLWRRPHALVSKGFDSSVVGIGVVVFDVRVRGAARARLVFEMLVGEFRVGCFNSEGERDTPVRCCGILPKHGLMMTEVNYHTYSHMLQGKCKGICIIDSVRGKIHLLISPLSPQITSPLSLVFHSLQLVIAQNNRLLPLHSWLCLFFLLFFLPKSVQGGTKRTFTI